MGNTNTTVTPTTWDGNYPLSDMPVGNTWTGTYGGASGCVGFAKMVLDATYGAGTSISSSSTWSTAAQAQSALEAKGINDGDRITFNNRDAATYGTNHAVVVVSMSSSGINVYDCNRTGTNKIGKGLLKWDYISTQYTSLAGGVHHN